MQSEEVMFKIGEFAAEVEQTLRDAAELKKAVDRGVGGREIALTHTKLEEAQMWLMRALSVMSDSVKD